MTAATNQSTADSVVTPSDLIVWMTSFGTTGYQGTRAMLEAEGVIPSGIKWPVGYDCLRWENGSCRFSLWRIRPEGAKCSRKQFIDGDWWLFQWDPCKDESMEARTLRVKQKELSDYINHISDTGRAEYHRQFSAYCESCDDEAFQSFKALIPGLVQPSRTRRPRRIDQSQETALRPDKPGGALDAECSRSDGKKRIEDER